MLIVAQWLKPRREMELALEVRNSAVRALEMNAQAPQQQLVEFCGEVQGAGKRSWILSGIQLTRFFQVSSCRSQVR
jgi:hypothetical protein